MKFRNKIVAHLKNGYMSSKASFLIDGGEDAYVVFIYQFKASDIVAFSLT